MRIRMTILAAFLLLLATTTGTWAQGSGVIEGQVLNASLDSAPVGGAHVTLWVSTADQAESSMETTADASGRFRFEGLQTEDRTYQLEVEYSGILYQSEVAAFPSGESFLSVPLSVYEPTTSSADISVERAHLIVGFEPGTIYVREVQVFFNAGDSTYVGPTGQEGEVTADFPLPQGASALELGEGFMDCCVVQTDTGLASTYPLLPGSTQFVLSYSLHNESTTYDLVKGIAHPTASLDVLAVDVGVQVTGSGFTQAEPLTIQGGNYLHLGAGNLAPGDEVALHFTNLPTEAMPEPSASPATVPPVVTWSVLGVIGLGVFLALVYPFLETSREEP
jgi:hypothetical protein